MSEERRPTPVGESIAEEHERIRALLAQIGGTAVPRELHTYLTELQDLLVRHFAHEEQPDGLHAIVTETAPRLDHRVKTLLSEHQMFLDSLARIIQQCDGCLGQIEHLRHEVHQFSARLEIHDAAESEILGDALYEDLGEND